MALRIEDYAIIGDCQSVALVGNDGSIDWLCLPRFDSGACFAALLGTPEHGRWLLAPVDGVRAARRRYRPGTLILETEFDTDTGGVTVIDFMPPRTSVPDLVRIVVGRHGEVRMRTELIVRFDYGWVMPWVRSLADDRGGIRATAGPDTLYLRTPVKLHGENMHTVGDFVVQAGQRVPFKLTYSETHHAEPPERDSQVMLRQTENWWRQWSSRCTYAGEWADEVMRSLVTLKALTYAPTGGIVAAATTSLPEHLGGVRNWDYRYCWLRDASFTLAALLTGGYTEEAVAWQDWLVNAVAGNPDELQIMYGVSGERRLTELILPWLPGYERSCPVRIGNGAYKQRQLDVYGEIAASLHLARRLGLPHNEDGWRVECSMLRSLEHLWRETDEGIWEVRGDPRHFTHSKVMAWVAFDRAVQAVAQFGLTGEADRWRAARDEIKRQVLAEGYNAHVGAFTQYYGSDEPDASLLMLPLVGFLPADDPRMLGTVKLVERHLVRDGFVDRYVPRPGVDGLPPGEGAFLLCTFWYADNLALQGRRDEGREVFRNLLGLCNDVGLLAEEYDPHTKRMLGNFPQAFSHIGLINTARLLSDGLDPTDRSAAQEHGLPAPEPR